MATYRTIITGASSGIGRAIALMAADREHSLVLNARSLDRLVEVVDLCKDRGSPSVRYVAYDVSAPETSIEIAEQLEGHGEGEIVLVNNAGCAEFGPFHETPIELSIAQVETMLNGTMRATHALLPLMIEQGKGTIVNVLSVASTHVFQNSEAYSAAKAGALAFSRCLAASYSGRGIRVITIIAGATDTDLWNGKEWTPPKEDMLSAEEVASKIIEAIERACDRTYEEITVLPPKGIL